MTSVTGEPEQLSHLIGDIYYDAALDPTLWVAALEKTCNYVGGVASALQSHDMLERSACFYFNARDGERWVAHVLPLTSGIRRKAGQDYSAVAAVFVRKAAFDLPHPMDVISNTYKLTPAEMRILMMIVQIGGVPEIAHVLGISETTVKTHLQHVFEKTGTQRQAELVKLVASYMSPLAA
jgi:DNA-binding CsgD family transcriptional regulator